jgi:hypothetical protein
LAKWLEERYAPGHQVTNVVEHEATGRPGSVPSTSVFVAPEGWSFTTRSRKARGTRMSAEEVATMRASFGENWRDVVTALAKRELGKKSA